MNLSEMKVSTLLDILDDDTYIQAVSSDTPKILSMKDFQETVHT